MLHYTADLLKMWKADQEARAGKVPELTDAQARQFIATMSNATAINGSNIISVNQMGGQTAHSIVNVGPQPRRFTLQAGNQLVAALKTADLVDGFMIEYVMGDGETEFLARCLVSVLTTAGWKKHGHRMSQFIDATPRRVHVATPLPHAGVSIFAKWLYQVGLSWKPDPEIIPALGRVEILVGTNL